MHIDIDVDMHIKIKLLNFFSIFLNGEKGNLIYISSDFTVP